MKQISRRSPSFSLTVPPLLLMKSRICINGAEIPTHLHHFHHHEPLPTYNLSNHISSEISKDLNLLQNNKQKPGKHKKHNHETSLNPWVRASLPKIPFEVEMMNGTLDPNFFFFISVISNKQQKKNP